MRSASASSLTSRLTRREKRKPAAATVLKNVQNEVAVQVKAVKVLPGVLPGKNLNWIKSEG